MAGGQSGSRSPARARSAAVGKPGEPFGRHAGEVAAEDRPVAHNPPDDALREVPARGSDGLLGSHDEPSGSAEPPDEVEVVADRQVAESACPIVGVAATEDSLVAVGQPSETGSAVCPPGDPPHRGAPALVRQGKGAGVRAPVERPADELDRAFGRPRIRVYEEEDVSARFPRRGGQPRSAASFGSQDPRADVMERLASRRPVAPVGDQQLALRIDSERGERRGRVRGLVAEGDDDGSQWARRRASDASIEARVKLPMPVAVLAGGASKRMGRPKAAMPWGAGNLLEFQTGRLAALFREVIVVAKEPPDFPVGPARVVLDTSTDYAAMYGLVCALAEAEDRMFVLAVDLPALTHDVVHAIATRGLTTPAAALVPEADGRLQPLAAVWRRSVMRFAYNRIARGKLSLSALFDEVGGEIFPESEWRALDPSGNSFANMNTLADWAAHRERA
jgi:molybdenum cofactor guanylyltransferase